MRDWYQPPEEPAQEDSDGPVHVEWSVILDHWHEVECDLHETFGIDVESGVLAQRTWRWLRTRIHDLITRPSRLRAVVMKHYSEEQE